MDPISIIGATGAVCNIIEVLAKTINALLEIRTHWKDAEMTLMSLLGQLTALKAALTKINDWLAMQSDDESHHQLVLDMGVSVSCCRTLVNKLEAHVSELRPSKGAKLTFAEKFELVFGGRSVDDLQVMIERQTSALTLLLAACSCKTLSEQQSMLDTPKTRQLFGQVEDETASLVVLRDSCSFSSPFSDNLSNLSRVFAFDRDLFASKVYGRSFRGFMKSSLRRQPPDPIAEQARKQSESIDRFLRREKLLPKVNVLMLGASELSRHRVFLDMYEHFGVPESISEAASYRLSVLQRVFSCAIAILQQTEPQKIQNDPEVFLELSDHLSGCTIGTGDKETSINIRHAFKSIYREPALWSTFIHQVGMFRPVAKPLFDDIERIISPEYQPTELDMLIAKYLDFGVIENRFKCESFEVRIVDIDRQFSLNEKKFMGQYEIVLASIFVVDLACYQTGIVEALELFDSFFNFPWSSTKGIILLLINYEEFEELLRISPFADYFTGYSGGKDAATAAEYIIKLFRQLNSRRLELYAHIIKRGGRPISACVTAVIKDINVQQALRASALW